MFMHNFQRGVLLVYLSGRSEIIIQGFILTRHGMSDWSTNLYVSVSDPTDQLRLHRD